MCNSHKAPFMGFMSVEYTIVYQGGWDVLGRESHESSSARAMKSNMFVLRGLGEPG